MLMMLLMFMVTLSCTVSTWRWVSSSCCAVSRHCSAGHRDPVTLVSGYVDMEMRRYVDKWLFRWICTWILNCSKVSESNNSDVRGFIWSSSALPNFFRWHVFGTNLPLTHHEFG